MFQLILAIHIVLCVFLVCVVLLQQGKGADAGVTFTGGSNTIFGVSGAGNVLTKATTGAAVLFMVTSLLLVKYYPVGGISTGGSVTDPLAGSVMGGQVTPKEDAADNSAAPAAKAVDTNPAPAADAPNQGSQGTSAPASETKPN